MQEWYLLTPDTRPNLSSGYENDSYLDYKDDEFAEILGTNIASTAELYNSDLSEHQTIRCVIQGNNADTELKTMQRTGLFSLNTVKAGMYLLFEDNYWLIDGRPGQCGVFEKTTLKLCQTTIKWQDANGNIHERWVHCESASKYDVGKTGNNILFIGSNNYTITIPQDEYTLGLDGKRVFIDIRKIPQDVFILTRDDNVLFHYGEEHGGILSFIVDKDECNPQKDRKDLRLCDYFDTTKEPSVEPSESDKDKSDESIAEPTCTATIKYRYKKVFVGKEATFTASFKDLDGNNIDKESLWEIDCDFKDSIYIEETASGINILLSDSSYIGRTFVLKLSAKDKTSTTSSLDIKVESLT